MPLYVRRSLSLTVDRSFIIIPGWGYFFILLFLALRHHYLGWKQVWKTAATSSPLQRNSSRKTPKRSGSLPVPVTTRGMTEKERARPTTTKPRNVTQNVSTRDRDRERERERQREKERDRHHHERTDRERDAARRHHSTRDAAPPQARPSAPHRSKTYNYALNPPEVARPEKALPKVSRRATDPPPKRR